MGWLHTFQVYSALSHTVPNMPCTTLTAQREPRPRAEGRSDFCSMEKKTFLLYFAFKTLMLSRHYYTGQKKPPAFW